MIETVSVCGTLCRRRRVSSLIFLCSESYQRGSRVYKGGSGVTWISNQTNNETNSTSKYQRFFVLVLPVCTMYILHPTYWYPQTTSSSTFAVTASNRQLSCIQWARENVCPWDQWTCVWAENGHISCLQWPIENGYPWDDTRTCSSASENGNLTALQLLRENGWPRDEKTCASVAVGWNLACLQWERMAVHGTKMYVPL